MHGSEKIEAAAEYVQDGLTITAAARRLGVRRETVSRWLHDGQALAKRRSRETVAGFPHRCADNCPAVERMDHEHYAYVLGLYLGDGCISREARAFHIRISQDAQYPQLITDGASSLRGVLPNNRVGVVRSGRTSVIYAYTQHAVCLFPQHGPGKKHLRQVELEGWQRQIVADYDWRFVAGLLHSDGWRSINRVAGKAYPRWQFTNLSADLHSLLRESLDRLGVPWTSSVRNTYITRRAAVALVDLRVPMKT